MINSPLLLHRQAFEKEANGDLCSAEILFKQALEGFATWIQDQHVLNTLVAKANQTSKGYDANAVADDLLAALPAWLLEVHFDRAARAISVRDIKTARSHWQILLSAQSLALLAGTGYLDICCDNLALRFFKESQIEAGDEQRGEFLKTAEQLLKIDQGLIKARLMAVCAYALEIELGILIVRWIGIKLTIYLL